MRKTVLFITLLLLTPAVLSAGWSRAGLWGADVRALVIDPRDPDTVYLGTSQGEVYLSRNGGRFWNNPRDGVPFPGYVVDNLVVDKKGRLWAACWGLWGGGVIAVSEDNGKSWSRRDAGLEHFSVRAIALDPSNADSIVVGGLTGVYRSSDSGITWRKISEQVNVESLAIDPREADRVYVGTWRQAWRTDDGGKSWNHVNNGMVLDTDVFSINIDPKNPDNVWLSTCGWVYNSVDRGDTWTRFKEGFNNRRIHAVAIDPIDSRIVYAGSVAGLYRTDDLGKTWTLVTAEEGFVINAVGLHKGRPERIILATEGDGIYISDDRGKTFARSSQGLHNVRIATVVADPEMRGRVYAAVLFGGAASGVYVSSDSGETWERMNRTKLPEILSLVVRAEVEPRFLAGTEQGVFYSQDGEQWSRAEPSISPIRVEKILPYNRTRLFAATAEGVLTSKDSGKSWYRLGGSSERTIDIAVGDWNGQRALFSLAASGVALFDGSAWSAIENAPQRGRSIAVSHGDGDHESVVVVAGVQGVKAGSVDVQKKWREQPAPTLSFASVIETQRDASSIVWLTSRDQAQLYVTERGSEWKLVTLPARLVDVAAIAADPFDRERFYLGTGGQGILIYSRKRAAVSPASPDQLSGGGSK